MYIGIEIGGTKLQVALGAGDGKLLRTWRGTVDPARGATGIQEQLRSALIEMKQQSKEDGTPIQSIGVGFGGPIDLIERRIIKSHQIHGWDGFPLAEWIEGVAELPCAIGNDADLAGLAEAILGAGRGYSPIFYITIGSGIGGGIVIDQKLYTGVGRGSAEIGHLLVGPERKQLELQASGWGIERTAKERFGREWTGKQIAELARQNDPDAVAILDSAIRPLAEAIRHVVCLLCPKRIIIGGGVSLMGDVFFNPLRKLVDENAFPPFRGLTEIVPAELGEEVVLHGAIELAKQR